MGLNTPYDLIILKSKFKTYIQKNLFKKHLIELSKKYLLTCLLLIK